MSGAPRHTHLYSTAVEADGAGIADDAYFTAHLVFDHELNIVRLGRTVTSDPDSLGAAARRALRDGLDDVVTAAHDLPAKVVVHEATLSNPELELGRLSTQHAAMLERTNVSVTPRMQNNCHKLLIALAAQKRDVTWCVEPHYSDSPTEPLAVFLDGSHKQPDHVDLESTDSGSTTFGYVIVDAEGRVLEAKASQFQRASESLHAEYLALKESVDAVKQMCPTATVTFNTDSPHLHHVLGDNNEPPPRFRPLAGYIRGALGTFKDATVESILRDQNMFADALAAVAHERHVEYVPFETSIDSDAAGYTYTV